MPLQDITNTIENAKSSKKHHKKQKISHNQNNETIDVENKRDQVQTTLPIVDSLVDRQIAQVHSLVKRETELEFSGPGEVIEGDLKRKRERKPAKSLLSGAGIYRIYLLLH